MTTTTEQPPDILSPEFAADPYSAYRIMRDEFPLIWHDGMKTYVISRYEDVQKAFKDPVFGSENYDWQLEPVHGRTILQMEGREHATHRALVAPAFRGRDLDRKFTPVIRQNSATLIDGFRRAGRVDLVDQYATRFPINVIVDMLGLPKSDHDHFHGWYTSIMAFLSNLTGDQQVVEEGLRTKEEFENYMIPVIQDRRRHPGDDLLSTLCQAEIDGVAMTDHEIKAFCSLLLTAGGETTDKAVASVFANLVAHPDQMAAVREDRSLVATAFAETLRHSPPVHMIMRQPKEDVALSGGTVEAGSTVTCLIGAANRDDPVRRPGHVRRDPYRPRRRPRVLGGRRPPGVLPGPALLRRRDAGQDRGRDRHERPARRHDRHPFRRRCPPARARRLHPRPPRAAARVHPGLSTP